MQALIRFLRANPQVFALLVICVVLGLGTFIAVLIAIAGSGSSTPSGEPSGAVAPLTALIASRVGTASRSTTTLPGGARRSEATRRSANAVARGGARRSEATRRSANAVARGGAGRGADGRQTVRGARRDRPWAASALEPDRAAVRMGRRGLRRVAEHVVEHVAEHVVERLVEGGQPAPQAACRGAEHMFERVGWPSDGTALLHRGLHPPPDVLGNAARSSA
ncbi:MAG: hypothetical protein JOZ07_12570 [Solirubrobacterales bacterium]|nr:hypothetical protein [Solirubrobacterales bacterium]